MSGISVDHECYVTSFPCMSLSVWKGMSENTLRSYIFPKVHILLSLFHQVLGKISGQNYIMTNNIVIENNLFPQKSIFSGTLKMQQFC